MSATDPPLPPEPSEPSEPDDAPDRKSASHNPWLWATVGAACRTGFCLKWARSGPGP